MLIIFSMFQAGESVEEDCYQYHCIDNNITRTDVPCDACDVSDSTAFVRFVTNLHAT